MGPKQTIQRIRQNDSTQFSRIKARFAVIAFDIVLWLFLVIWFLVTRGAHQKYLWFITLYSMTATYYIALGPHHTRPMYLVLCAVSAALLFGVRTAAMATVLNAALLMALYWLVGPTNEAWASTYAEPLSKWVTTVVNSSIVTLATSLPVGSLLDKLSHHGCVLHVQ